MATVKMKSDGDTASFVFGEAEYKVDEQGTIEVPAGAVETARSHGFTVPGEKKPVKKRVEQGR